MALLTLPIVSKEGLKNAADESDAEQAPVDPQLAVHYRALTRAKSLGYDDAVQVIQQRIADTTHKLQDQMATRGMTPGDQMLSGIGGGMSHVAKGAADVATLGMRSHDPQADEDDKRARAQLEMTGPGGVGNMVGEQAALTPLTMGVGGLMGKAAAGTGRLGLTAASKLLSSAPVRAGVEGAVAGAADAEPGDRLEGAALGGAAAVGLTKGAQLLRRGYTGVVKPTPSADYLRRQGVDLTLGQMNPGGKLAQLEEASQSVAGSGRTIENQRMAGRQSFQDVALGKTLPPGGSLPPREPGNMSSRIDDIYKGFGPAYDAAVKGESVYPATHGQTPTPFQTTSTGKKLGSFDLAVLDPSVASTDAERATAKRFLDNQLSILPGGTSRPPMLAQVPAEQLQTMRSNIRSAIRDEMGQGGSVKVAKLLVNAEKQVGEALDTQLKNPGLLRATDRQYSRYKVVEGAQAAANGQPGDFTPAQMLRQVKKGMSDGLFARGGGGDMRRLAIAGRDVLDARVPATGARVLTHSVPAALGYAVGGPAGAAGGAAAGPTLTASALAMMNKQPFKNMLTGNTAPQRAAQMLETALKRGLGQSGRQKAQDTALIVSALLGNHAARAANGD